VLAGAPAPLALRSLAFSRPHKYSRLHTCRTAATNSRFVRGVCLQGALNSSVLPGITGAGKLMARQKRTYCFDAEAFDKEAPRDGSGEFDAIAFVSTARALAPLDRLRDDLQSYLTSRKEELYDLINRDYAEFIVVSSKLSGVGSKAAELRAPIGRFLEIVSALGSSVGSTARSLELKMAQRDAVQTKRRSIERALRFLGTLEKAENILGIGDGWAGETGEEEEGDEQDAKVFITSSHTPGSLPRRQPQVRDQDRDQNFDKNDDQDQEEELEKVEEEEPADNEEWDDEELTAMFPGFSSSAVDSREGEVEGEGEGEGEGGPNVSISSGNIFNMTKKRADANAETECANLERVAHYALMLNADLQAASEAGVEDNASRLLRSMSAQASRVEAEVTRRLRSEFASLVRPKRGLELSIGLTSGLTSGQTSAGLKGTCAEGGAMRRALLSCLRPFAALGCGVEAEKQFARVVMQPYLDARFTAGIVDGGVRGSGQGLSSLLTETLAYIKEVG
ncbi:unnamed protein product, partial [Discosporangium mesarthrocarpum]